VSDLLLGEEDSAREKGHNVYVIVIEKEDGTVFVYIRSGTDLLLAFDDG
jgi:hypothetical protein